MLQRVGIYCQAMDFTVAVVAEFSGKDFLKQLYAASFAAGYDRSAALTNLIKQFSYRKDLNHPPTAVGGI